MDASGKLPEYYITVLGDSNVGKQCIRRRFVDNVWLDPSSPSDGTLKGPRTSKIITTKNQQQCVVHVWEYSGADRETQERLIRGCEGVILVYSITDRRSFEHVKALYDQVRSIKGGDQVVIYLVGSKCDLDNRRQVATIEAIVLASKLKLGEPLFEVSAMTGENVDRVFDYVVREIQKCHAETGTNRFFKTIRRVFGGV